jgi:redox-sensitive bicupin YhaK (pirin superfamily)
MEKILHKAEERGGGDHGWLSTRHSFSFADWYEPTRMGFGALRVINDDTIAPHQGFGAHPHRDMEIITLVTGGTLTHEDSMGNLGVVEKGEVQIMSAGTGVVHGERNDGDEPLTLFQIWIEAKEKGIAPRYGQSEMHLATQAPGLTLLVAPLGTSEALTINQDALIHHGLIDSAHPLAYTLHDPAHGVYIFVIDGEVTVAGETLGARDALGITSASTLSIESGSSSHFLLFEVPMD